MITRPRRTEFRGWTARGFLAVVCALHLTQPDTAVYAQQAEQQAAVAGQAVPSIPSDQLDSLVAPIALYPDPLLSQVLVASTYPLEIIQLQQWLAQQKDLKGHALVAAVEAENWDPSIQAMAVLPDAVKQLAENIKWTTDLGNAFLAQETDVMNAVQRMRVKAMDAGNLKSTEQQKVETTTVESKTVVVIEQANPEVVYVPSYNPVVVYGPPVYPYPPIIYPPPGYYAGAAIAFGVGIAIGAAYRGGWGYHPAWNSNNNIIINNRNNFIANSNRINVSNRPSQLPAGAGNAWQHNPQHRGGTPYSNRAIANQYGGSERGDSVSNRQVNARQQQGLSNRQQPSAANRSAFVGDRAGSNATGARTSNTGANRASGGGNNIGGRQLPSNNASRGTSAFGGSTSRSNARASSARGASSMGGSRGGGRRSGGGRRR